MTQPADPHVPAPPRSMPPSQMTGPMVWYAFVRELPGIMGIVAGAFVAALFMMKNPGASVEPIVAALAPPIIAALARSKPAESETIQRLTGAAGAGLGPLMLLWLRQHMGLVLPFVPAAGVISLVVLSGCSAQADQAALKSAENDAVCFLERFGENVGAGQNDQTAAESAGVFCTVEQVKALAIARAHRRAMVREGFVLRPQPPGDSGRD